jgi:hypothetical protein
MSWNLYLAGVEGLYSKGEFMRNISFHHHVSCLSCVIVLNISGISSAAETVLIPQQIQELQKAAQDGVAQKDISGVIAPYQGARDFSG